MFSLIVVVITIGLMAALIATTINYVPMEAHQRQQMQKEVDRGIKALECAVTRFLDANRGTDGNILYPGDGVDMVSAVTPAYGFMPAQVRKEMNWEVTTGQVSGMPAVGICIRPAAISNEMQREVLANLQSQYPVGSTFVGSSCNATANVADGAFMTFWVPIAHVN